MAKYLTEFNTYAEYSGATLSLPNVSLIKSTGKVYYKNIFAGDALGDVLMYDIANDKLVTTLNAQWSAESFPIASYTPIAINVYPASQTPDGKNRYMAIRWASNASSTGSRIKVGMRWGPDDFIPSTDENAFNGRANQDAAELVMPGTTGNTQAEYAAFYACSIFAPQGTSAGDWYLPSKGELSKYYSNYSSINNIISAIKTAAGSTYINDVNENMASSTSYDNMSQAFHGLTNSPSWSGVGKLNTYYGTRAMISL